MEIFKSKKSTMTLIAAIVSIIMAFVPSIDEETLKTVVAAIVTIVAFYLTSQAAADFGKEKEKERNKT